ncbi:hypothetical protein [Aurantiacibacter gilvus]|uniref:Uncharacterized protein n=1 Tax=Aurantiacibacter gilvus TaxID=3139141 RepID=A0ABU9IDX3_9SPHN
MILLEIGPSPTEFQDVDGEILSWSQRARELGREIEIPRAVLPDQAACTALQELLSPSSAQVY